MKNLKAILVVCLLSLGLVSANAQGLRWGAKAGLNVSTVTDVNDGEYKAGFNVGVIGQYMFSGNEGFGLEAGLQYSMLGYKVKSGEALGIKYDGKTFHASYIQLPIQALYKFGVGQNLYLYPSLGVYLGYGIGGTNFLETVEAGSKTKYFDVCEEFDFGLKVGLNLQFESILIGVGYDYGLTKVVKDTDAKNSNISVSVGYLF